MNKLQIITAREAYSDIKTLKSYISKDNKIAAKQFALKLKKSFELLSVYPKMGKCRPDLSCDNMTMFLPVMKNYLIVYKFDNRCLYILRVLSDYQNICTIL